METKTHFLKKLVTKLYLADISFYTTICLVITLPVVLVKTFELPQLFANFVIFFVVSFLRATYESLIIYEAPVKSLSTSKMLTLSLINSGTIALIIYFLSPMLGYFSIPVSLTISMIFVQKLKTYLWPQHGRLGFFNALPIKLSLATKSKYLFFAFLIGITYCAYGIYGFNFFCSFAIAYFISMMFEELYNAIKIYEQSLTITKILMTILWAISCAVLSVGFVFALINFFNLSGQIATIMSIIFIKLIQPIAPHTLIFTYSSPKEPNE